jgi:hypothetical protein
MTDAVLSREAWAHAIAAVIVELAHQECLARGAMSFAAGGFGRQ